MHFLTIKADGSNDFLTTVNSFANNRDRLANVYWECDVTVHKCSVSLFCSVITGKWCLPKWNYLCELSLRQCRCCDKLPVKWTSITWIVWLTGWLAPLTPGSKWAHPGFWVKGYEGSYLFLPWNTSILVFTIFFRKHNIGYALTKKS